MGDNTIKPLVSICCIAYNQEQYIEKTLAGFAMQKTDFPIEIIIYDDYSQDSTRQLLTRFKEQSSVPVTLLFPDENKYSKGERIFLKTFREAKGKYIAPCEGDDYWTDPLKLQKQVNALEDNPECVVCFTNSNKLLPNGDIIKKTENSIPRVSGFEELIQGNYISTLTVLLNREKALPVPNWYHSLKIGDWPLYLWMLRDGDRIFFLEESTAVYRKNIGISTKMRQDVLQSLKIIKEVLVAVRQEPSLVRYRAEINQAISKNSQLFMSQYIKQGKIAKGTLQFLRLFLKRPSTNLIRHYLYAFKRTKL